MKYKSHIDGRGRTCVGVQTIGLDRIDPADLQTMVNGFDFTGFLLDTDLGKLTAVNYLLVYGLGTFQWSWVSANASGGETMLCR